MPYVDSFKMHDDDICQSPHKICITLWDYLDLCVNLGPMPTTLASGIAFEQAYQTLPAY